VKGEEQESIDGEKVKSEMQESAGRPVLLSLLTFHFSRYQDEANRNDEAGREQRCDSAN
jgi:hypothetical protein